MAISSHKFLAAGLAMMLGTVLTQSANAQSIAKIASEYSVSETLDRLAKALEARGIKIVARVDHAAGAKAVGMTLPPTEVLIFGNPKLGTPLMQANPEIGLDLPMKVIAWQTIEGNVMVGYAPAAELKTRYGISGQDPVFDAMTQALAGLTKSAATKN